MTSAACSLQEQLTTGLTDIQALTALEEHGRNEIPSVPACERWTKSVITAVANPLIVLLFLLAFISFMTDDMAATTIISLTVLTSLVIGISQEFKADLVASKLKKAMQTSCHVLRGVDGKTRTKMLAAMLVPDDIVLLTTGDLVPADVMILAQNHLHVNQSAISGEALPVAKMLYVDAEQERVAAAQQRQMDLRMRQRHSGNVVGGDRDSSRRRRRNSKTKAGIEDVADGFDGDGNDLGGGGDDGDTPPASDDDRASSNGGDLGGSDDHENASMSASHAGMCYMGTFVESGTATCRVVHTGARTYVGRVAEVLSSDDGSQTDFDRGIHTFTWLMIKFMAVMAPLCFGLNILVHGVTREHVSESFVYAVALAVGLTPEMLPMIVSTCLVTGSLALSQKGVVVKKLKAVQNFGSMDVFCTDKTGSLTRDEITLERFTSPFGGDDDEWLLELALVSSVHQTGIHNAIEHAILNHRMTRKRAARLLESRYYDDDDDDDAEDGADDDGKDAGEFTPGQLWLPRSVSLLSLYDKVGELPFDFGRRRLSVCVRLGADVTSASVGHVSSLTDASTSTAWSSTKPSWVRDFLLSPTTARDNCFLVCKGAVVEVLSVCSRTRAPPSPANTGIDSSTSATSSGGGGAIVPLTPTLRSQIVRVADDLSRQGYRVIGVCGKRMPMPAPATDAAAVDDDNATALSLADESDMVFFGFLAFIDPPKESAAAAIASLQTLGVDVKVLTGDSRLITEHICTRVGIAFDAATQVVVGDDVEQLSDAALGRVAEHAVIFARLQPHHKARIIHALRNGDNPGDERSGGRSSGSVNNDDIELGEINRPLVPSSLVSDDVPATSASSTKTKAADNFHVVGFLGDGINDCLALRAADVGITVDTAVDVAKESADVLMITKSLLVLEEGVVCGRATFANICKFVEMGASSNFGNMISVVGASAMLPFIPMAPLQVLLNNFLYDLSQVALPSDNVDIQLLRKPRPWRVDEIRRFVLLIGPISSLFDYITFAVLFFYLGFDNHDDPVKVSSFHTGWFIESLLSQTLIVHVLRTRGKPFQHSTPSYFLVVLTTCIMVFGAWLPYSDMAHALGFIPLGGNYWRCLALILPAYLVLTQLLKDAFYSRIFISDDDGDGGEGDDGDTALGAGKYAAVDERLRAIQYGGVVRSSRHGGVSAHATTSAAQYVGDDDDNKADVSMSLSVDITPDVSSRVGSGQQQYTRVGTVGDDDVARD